MKRMTTPGEKWAAAFLAAVCLFLVLNFVRRAVRAAGTRPTLSPVQGRRLLPASRAPERVRDELSRYDPELNLEALKELDERPLPRMERNPFEYPRAAPVKPASSAGTGAAPPPPPPLPLHAVGFTEGVDRKPKAMIKDEEGIYVVGIGETFAKHYRVLSISPKNVEVQDASSGQTAQLPIPE